MLFTIVICCLPLIFFIWSRMEINEGGDGKKYVYMSVISLILIVIASIVTNIYLRFQYDLDFFTNIGTLLIFIFTAVFLSFLIFIILLIVYFVAYVRKKMDNAPSLPYVFIFPACVGIFIFVFGMWVYPLGEKLEYTSELKDAGEHLAESDDSNEISVAFRGSEKDCIKCRGKMNVGYDNRFFVQNKFDDTKLVWLELEALDDKNNVIKTIESNKEVLEPNQYTMITTEETSDNQEMWAQHSFKTDTPIASYNYRYHYEKPE